MPQGLQMWDANGNKILDTNDSIPRIIGEFASTYGPGWNAATGTGYLYDTKILGGRFWWFLRRSAGVSLFYGGSLKVWVDPADPSLIRYQWYEYPIRYDSESFTTIVYGVY